MATQTLIDDYKLFASIPCLSYPDERTQYNMGAITHVKDHLESLEQGLDYLKKIKELYCEANQVELE